MIKVDIVESEAGWGQRVDETKEFDTLDKAERFCRDYNTKYNPPSKRTPSWYMYAIVRGGFVGPMLRHEKEN